MKPINKPQFILVGDYIHSMYDGDKHYISANQLLKLYNLPRYQCVAIDEEIPHRYLNCIDDIVNPWQIFLYPLEIGTYKEHLDWCMNKWRQICELE